MIAYTAKLFFPFSDIAPVQSERNPRRKEAVSILYPYSLIKSFDFNGIAPYSFRHFPYCVRHFPYCVHPFPLRMAMLTRRPPSVRGPLQRQAQIGRQQLLKIAQMLFGIAYLPRA